MQLLSVALLRWGDTLQTRNRGRTGGVRQMHRLQLLEKLMMLDHEQQWQVAEST